AGSDDSNAPPVSERNVARRSLWLPRLSLGEPVTQSPCDWVASVSLTANNHRAQPVHISRGKIAGGSQQPKKILRISFMVGCARFPSRLFRRSATAARVELPRARAISRTMLRSRRAPVRATGFIEPWLPSRARELPGGSNWLHEIKHDGYRMMVR